MTSKPDKPQHDWEAIERDYRAGLLSVREIGRFHGLSHTAIQKKANDHSWTRDLKAKIQAEAAAAVARQALAGQVAEQKLATETDIVRANAALQAEVIRQHRSGIKNLTTTADRLTQRLSTVMVQLESKPVQAKQKGKTGAPPRPYKENIAEIADAASVLESLVRTTARLIPLERQAFGLKREEEMGNEGEIDTTAVSQARRNAHKMLEHLAPRPATRAA